MGDLMCIADNVEIMTSICEVCKSEEAVFTFYKGGAKDKDIEVGDSQYLPVCRQCYEKMQKNLK